MRLFVAALAAMLVALVATPSAHAGSPQRSMPRTFRGPAGMVRCIEAPISLAFDVVEREAARFAAPESLTSRDAGPRMDLRTRASAESAALPAVRVRAAAAPAHAPRPAPTALPPCGRTVTRLAACASIVDADGPLSLDPPRSEHAVLVADVSPELDPTVATEARDACRAPASAVEGRPLDAHGLTPWRPPTR